MYKQNYKKYKTKYLGLLFLKQIGGEYHKHILLDGTSSSGKSTISKLFGAIGYKHIAFDDFMSNDIWGKIESEYLKTIDINDYADQKKRYVFIDHRLRLPMYEEGTKHNLVIYDDVDQSIATYYDNDSLFIIIIYTSPNNLVDNIFKRRNTEPRGLGPFHQFAERYEVTNGEVTNGNKTIDTIDKPSFIDKLKQKLKYEFDSETTLNEFANDFFKKIGIEDDLMHQIKLRDNYRCDYLVKTNGRDRVDIFKELYDKIK